MVIIKNIVIFIAVLIVSTMIVGQIRGYYSDDFENFLIGIALTFLIIFVWKKTLGQKQQNITKKETSKNDDTLNEDVVNKIQTNFEKRLLDTYLPDAITHKSLYIYRHLMCEWFAKLAGRYRYDSVMIQKIRNDWIDYMSALEDRNTYNFLSLESDNEDEEESYREQHINASRKVYAIEDAFALAIGKEAEEKLNYTRELSVGCFSKDGDIAPKGYKFKLNDELYLDNSENDNDLESLFEEEESNEDELYEEAKRIVIEGRKASASLMQRRLKIGYTRAARLMDMLEERGVVSEANGAEPRKVLLSKSND